MELSVHGKQMDVGDALRTHVKDKLQDVSEKYFNHTTFASVTFSREGHGHPRTKAHISIQAGKNILIVADGLEADPYVAFDSACTKAAKQLRRYKRRLRDHQETEERTPETEIQKARNYVLASMPDSSDNDNDSDEAGDDPLVIAEMASQIETITVSDAVMRLELSRYPVLMFRNKKNDQINVIYRREDGNIGWIDPDNL